nr:hypothetical protein [uncultured Cellulomonas sp.]
MSSDGIDAPRVDAGRVEADRIDSNRIDSSLVRALLREQFPAWSQLPVRPVDPGGNDHRMFRLGDEPSVRLPSAAGYVPQVAKEQTWLPRLGPSLPLPVPVVFGVGRRPCTSRHRGRCTAGSTASRRHRSISGTPYASLRTWRRSSSRCAPSTRPATP